MSATDPVTVTTAQGTVAGAALADGVVVFRGIPYAAPPVGAYRLRAPQPPPAWDGVRDATRFEATYPQTGYEGAVADLLPNLVIEGRNSLNLNVWTPRTDGRRPVMVFVHGGAFVQGAGSVPGYDGTAFARDGIVLVTLNYRLGFDGFGWVDGGIQNRGLLDQVAALRWVQQNIAAFGGDPERVTVFGESAGAMSIGCLLAMPRARGLFRRAILQSGAASNALDPGTARRTVRRLAARLGVSPSADAFATVDGSDLLAAQKALRTGPAWRRLLPGSLGSLLSSTMLFQPVVDGTVLPERPLAAIGAGSADGVEIMAGFNSEESRLFLVPGGMIDEVTWRDVWAVATVLTRNPRHTVRTLRESRPGTAPGDVLDVLLTHQIYRLPARMLAAAHPRTRLYEFTWRSPAHDGRLGACHAVELPFVFDLLDHPCYRGLTGGAAPQDLADEVHTAWAGFAGSGDPGWGPHDAHSPVARRLGPDGPWVDPITPGTGIRWRSGN